MVDRLSFTVEPGRRYLPIAGLLALGLGAISRNTAGALATFIGLMMVLPPLLAPLPEGSRGSVVQYLPEPIASSPLGAWSMRPIASNHGSGSPC